MTLSKAAFSLWPTTTIYFQLGSTMGGWSDFLPRLVRRSRNGFLCFINIDSMETSRYGVFFNLLFHSYKSVEGVHYHNKLFPFLSILERPQKFFKISLGSLFPYATDFETLSTPLMISLQVKANLFPFCIFLYIFSVEKLRDNSNRVTNLSFFPEHRQKVRDLCSIIQPNVS